MSARARKRHVVALLTTALVLTAAVGAAFASADRRGSQAARVGNTAISPAAAVATATKVTKQYSVGKVTWQGPTTKVPFAKDKLILLIDINAATQTSQRLIASAREAAKFGGWKIQVIDAQGSPDKWNAAFQTAIQLHADGIIDVAIEANFAPAALAKVKKAGIPIISTIASTGKANVGNPAITHVVSEHNHEMGYVLGAQIVKDTGGKAKIGVLQFPGGVDDEELAGTREWLAKNGGGEVSAYQNFAVTDVGTPAFGQLAVSLLQAHPDINALWIPWDSPAADAITAIKQAGLGNRVKIYSFYSNSPNLNWIRSGTVQVADMSVPLEWEAWAAVDGLNRVFNKQPVAKNDGLPFRLLTKSNLPPAGQNWTGEFDYKSAYKKLWGVK